MSANVEGDLERRDYSLVGSDSTAAVESGLADAQWYASPVPREAMRELLERRDGPAIRDTLIWFGLLLAFGVAGYALWGSAWAILPFLCYGVIYASTSDSRWHESSHGTAFETDWMNNALYEIASFMVLRESTPWRWSHARHHSDTIIVGRDPEIAVPRPVNLLSVALKFVNISTIFKYFQNVLLHATGKVTPQEATYIPESAYGQVFARARIYLLIYAGVIGLAVATRSFLPLMFIGLPSLYGAWLMVVYGLTQHAGLAEDVLDHRLNTRTVYMNALNRYLYWNMGYHVEHHMYPMVPYHSLPKLHAQVKADMPAPYHGLLDAYREIIPTLVRQSQHPTYYVKRPLPPAGEEPASFRASQTVVSDAQADADGWVGVCDLDRLLPGEVLRFDHRGKTYAIYRTVVGQLFATEGACTHGNAQLADGFLQGTTIECPKHNGRFDVRDGSVRRPPPCVALRAYEAREKDGQLLLNVAVAYGKGATDAVATAIFHVVSNDNVTPTIKELVLEPEGQAPGYRPGDYLQFEIPRYAERTLDDVSVNAPFDDVWKDQGLAGLRAANPATTWRSYSMASNPATARNLVFNVRLATPPRGLGAPAGVGSSYLFSLRSGDRVAARGPQGAFHIMESDREMVYLGGGSGMAPLRSHISYLFETQHTARRVSYWYGARSLMEIYYEAYFEALAREQANFTFHVALSEPRPEDNWEGQIGFIHEVLGREYLESHTDPTQIEYYLCGPLPMIRAAMKMLADFGVPPEQIASDEF